MFAGDEGHVGRGVTTVMDGEDLDHVWQESIDDANDTSHCKGFRVIIHVDIDCFYAQVETIKNPTLKGKKVGVQQKNLVITTNYVARLDL